MLGRKYVNVNYLNNLPNLFLIVLFFILNRLTNLIFSLSLVRCKNSNLLIKVIIKIDKTSNFLNYLFRIFFHFLIIKIKKNDLTL